ncbi:MAG TPA: MFS transporter [Gaiellales bacterium]|jgi:MFS family permease|nr:MFS transporter [Gaiellales bacterium]
MQLTRAERSPWTILGMAVGMQFGVSLIDQGVLTLTGFIKLDLGLSAFAAGLVVASFALGRIMGAYAAGLAADRLGEQRTLLVGGVATAAIVLAASLMPLPVFVPLMVLAGAAGASATPAGGRLVLLAFPRNRRGFALGIRQTGIPVGGLIAAATLPWIAHVASWRWSLAAAACVTALTAIPLLGLRAAPPPPRPKGPQQHVGRNRDLLMLTAWGCLIVTGQYALVAFLALDLNQGAGLTLAEGSILVALANVAGIVGRVLWGLVSDGNHGGSRKAYLLTINVVGLVGAVLLFVVPPTAPILLIGVIVAIAGLALIGYQGLWITMIAEVAGPDRVGAATGFAITFVAGAIALSPPLYGLVADVAGTYRAIWAVLACVLVVALLPAALVREHAAEQA